MERIRISKNKQLKVAPDTDQGYRTMFKFLNWKQFLGMFFVFSLFLCLACSEEVVCSDENHPHAVDLGLPSGNKWACCNVGAPLPEEFGGFYSWGETEVKPNYDEVHYRHGELSHMIPQRMGNIAGSEYDVANVRNGSSWVMPSSNQWQELVDYCKWEWVKYKGHHGWMVTGPNRNHIFLPAGGMKAKTQWSVKDDHGYYWASDYESEIGPFYFYTNGGCRDIRVSSGSYNVYGYNVRSILSVDE